MSKNENKNIYDVNNNNCQRIKITIVNETYNYFSSFKQDYKKNFN